MNQDLLPALSTEMTVNEIVQRYPVSVTVFKAFGIDTCWGGALPLETVLQKHQLEASGVLEALQDVIARG